MPTAKICRPFASFLFLVHRNDPFVRKSYFDVAVLIMDGLLTILQKIQCIRSAPMSFGQFKANCVADDTLNDHMFEDGLCTHEPKLFRQSGRSDVARVAAPFQHIATKLRKGGCDQQCDRRFAKPSPFGRGRKNNIADFKAPTGRLWVQQAHLAQNTASCMIYDHIGCKGGLEQKIVQMGGIHRCRGKGAIPQVLPCCDISEQGV